jgi:hypothetical protein
MDRYSLTKRPSTTTPSMQTVAWLAVIAVLSTLVAGCGNQPEADGEASRPTADKRTAMPAGAEGRPAPSAQMRPRRAHARQRRLRRPSIEVVTPARRDVVRGTAVSVRVSVKGFEVVPQRVRPPFPRPVSGKGHVHFYLDTKRLPTRHGPPSTGAYRSLSATSYTWTGVAPGTHSLAAQLVGKDHAPLRPRVKDRVTVEVRP